MADPIIPINPSSDMSQIVSMVNQNFAQVQASSVTRVYNDRTGTPSIIEGILPNGNTGIQIALPGFNVNTATSGQLAFDSSKSFTVNLNDTFTFPSLGSVADGDVVFATTQAIPHNSTLIPASNCYAPVAVGAPDLSALFPSDFPTTAVSFIGNAGLIYQTGFAFFAVFYGCDATNFYLGMSFTNDTGSTITALPLPVTYFVFTLNTATS